MPGSGTATVLVESAAVRQQQRPLKESIMVDFLLRTRSGPANIHPFNFRPLLVPRLSLLSSPCKVPSFFSTAACLRDCYRYVDL